MSVLTVACALLVCVVMVNTFTRGCCPLCGARRGGKHHKSCQWHDDDG